MIPTTRALLSLTACLLATLTVSPALSARYSAMTIVVGSDATDTESRYARLLADRLHDATGIEPQITTELSATDLSPTTAASQLTVLLGTADRHPLLAEACRPHRIALPTATNPGAEGFVLRTLAGADRPTVVACGSDERGVLYAVGELLRQIEPGRQIFELTAQLDIRTAPAFWLRGTEVSQGHTMRQLTGAREWTEDEWRRVVLDYALAGANTFGAGHVTPAKNSRFHFLKSYGLKTLTSLGPNTGSGPEEWRAVEAIGRTGYLCLSVPEARAALLQRFEQQFANSVAADYVRMYSGDGGGCECERCAPYGKRYIEMCADVAAIIHRHHPQTKIFATNQKLDNAGDRAIFAYLNEQPRPWLTALCFGPGSNAMSWQPGRRQDHRLDLFTYPGFGPEDGYLKEMLHQLPPPQSIVFFTDLTHWVYSQYGLVNYHPDPDSTGNVPPHWGAEVYAKGPNAALDMVYDRRTFHARPRNYYRVFQETMRYGEGDVTYSEGHHDHANQWIWQRLLWQPHLSLDDVLAEYTRLWFGRDAAPLMQRAMLQLEENLTAELATNAGIDQLIALVREAGERIPPERLENNYLWRQYLQKGLLDRYTQLRLRNQQAAVRNVYVHFAAGLVRGDTSDAITAARTSIDSLVDTPEMQSLRIEAKQLGDQSARIFGVRNTGLFSLEQDFVGLGWLSDRINAAAAVNGQQQLDIVRGVVHHTAAGEGGFYDNAGEPGGAPHMTHGYPYSEYIAAVNRPSQRSAAFTTAEEQGVTFEYDGLDPEATYRVRVALVRPKFTARFGAFQPQTSESLFADEHCLARDIELPLPACELFEFDIPHEATRDGELKLWFEKSAGVGEGPRPQVTVWRNTGGWGTLVSEIWLLKNAP